MKKYLIEKYLTVNETKVPKMVADKVKKLRKQGKSDEEISKLLKIRLNTIEKISEENYIVKYKAKDKKGKVIEKEKNVKATSDKAAAAIAKRGDKNYYDSISVKLDEASGAGGSSEIWFGYNRSTMIYEQEGEVLFSLNYEFPPGSKMDDETRQRAIARGYVLLDVK